jgi:hypothetical protein
LSQSTFIAGALIAGFVLFLAARNRLSAYAAVLWGSTAAQVPPPNLANQLAGAGAAGANQAITGGGIINQIIRGLLGGPFLGLGGGGGAAGAAAGASSAGSSIASGAGAALTVA